MLDEKGGNVVNGLDAILNRIMSDAADRIRDINEQTDARCAALLATADQDAAKIISEARRRADEQAAALLRRSESLSALEARKMILSSRQTLIDEVIEQAAGRLSSLPAAEKSVLYTRLLMENAAGHETVVFTREDASIADKILSAVNQEKGWQLTLDPTPGEFAGGLILRQGLIETNLTVGVLIRSLRPELVSLAAKALFGE